MKMSENKLSDEQLRKILGSINRGVSEAYVYRAFIGHIPRKEVIITAANDIKRVLDKSEQNDNRPSIQRLRKYAEIIEMLKEMPGEDLTREEDFCKRIYFLMWAYSRNIEVTPYKYDLIAEQGKLEDKLSEDKLKSEHTDGSTKKHNNRYIGSTKSLVELASKFIELLDI